MGIDTAKNQAGSQIFTVSHALLNFSLIAEPAETFEESLTQLLPAEKCLLQNVVFYEVCDAETVLVQYLQVPCTVFIGTDGGNKDSNRSFSWVIGSPGQEKLVHNSGPVDGWRRRQSSLRSKAMAISSVMLYLDEMAEFYSVTIQCCFHVYMDHSKGAISTVEQLRDMIPKRKHLNHADTILTTMRDAQHVSLNT
jgi:hypothetical protein